MLILDVKIIKYDEFIHEKQSMKLKLKGIAKKKRLDINQWAEIFSLLIGCNILIN